MSPASSYQLIRPQFRFKRYPIYLEQDNLGEWEFKIFDLPTDTEDAGLKVIHKDSQYRNKRHALCAAKTYIRQISVASAEAFTKPIPPEADEGLTKPTRNPAPILSSLSYRNHQIEIYRSRYGNGFKGTVRDLAKRRVYFTKVYRAQNPVRIDAENWIDIYLKND